MSLAKAVGRRMSRFLARRPALLFKVQEGWLRFGHRVLDLSMASWVIRRPEWLREKPEGLRKALEPALPADGAGVALAERSIAALRSAGGGAASAGLIPAESIWGGLLQSHYANLRSLVERGDSAALAAYQGRIFRTESVNGFSYGTTFDTWPHRWHYLPLQIELSVVQLAEALGILRAECHEQGRVAFWRSLFTEEQLIERIEAHFGFRVEQPRHGDPRGIMFGGRFLARETCSHLYTAYRMKSAIERQGVAGPLDIVEIGGGYGGTCYWLRKTLGPLVGRYVIVDLPEVGLVQATFLGGAEPASVVMRGESRSGKATPIELVPHFALAEIDFRPNIVINQDSMPEMPESEVERYLAWAAERLDGLFLSFNQETFSPAAGLHQVFVPALAARFPRLRRISRDTSWDRRGYVEEVYDTRSGLEG